MDDPITIIAGALGATHEQVIVTSIVAVAASNVVGRLIPDDKKGALGFVRKLAKVVGLYASNRVASGVSVNRVVRDIADDRIVR